MAKVEGSPEKGMSLTSGSLMTGALIGIEDAAGWGFCSTLDPSLLSISEMTVGIIINISFFNLRQSTCRKHLTI